MDALEEVLINSVRPEQRSVSKPSYYFEEIFDTLRCSTRTENKSGLP